MLIHGRCSLVGKRDLLVQKAEIAAFREIFEHGGEEPQRVVRPVSGVAGVAHIFGIFRTGLLSGLMRELHQREAAAVVDLGGEHEADLVRRHFRFQVDHALDILHRIPVAVAVAQAAVDEGGRPRPDEGHKAVVGVPDIDHGVELRAGCLDLEMGEALRPVRANGIDLIFPEGRICRVFLHDRGTLGGSLFSQNKEDGPGRSGIQCDLRRDRTAAVAVVTRRAAEVSLLYAQGISVSVPGPQKGRLVSAPGGGFCPRHAEKSLGHRFIVCLFAF